MSKKYVYDIETYPNLFTFVAIEVDVAEDEEPDYFECAIYEDDKFNQAVELYYFLYDKPILIGYNNIGFDNQVIEFIWQTECNNAREIYEFVQTKIIGVDRFEVPYAQWNMTFKPIDLMTMNNYGIGAKATSLKWLEFSMRDQRIADLPIHHTQEVTEAQVDEVLKYNGKDTRKTLGFYEVCQGLINMRKALIGKFKDPLIMNQPNSSIGEKIVLYAYCEQTGKDPRQVKKKYTKRKKIDVADVILPYIEFEQPIFQEVLSDFQALKLKANSKGVLPLKGVYEKEIEWQNMKIKYALGGIHGCVPSGIYHSSETHVIKTYDVTSMYPNIAISNGFHPEHLGEVFCEVYKNILRERKKYPKSENLEMNLAYKEAANSVYGKSNSSYNGFLKDPRYTVQTTVNGQLVLTMLAERLSHLGEFLMLNTDGSEIIIPRDKEEEYQQICDEWCKLTGIELEHDEYETMWIKDVNNYIAKFTSGKVKRKGAIFCIYDDYIGNWHKNPSGLIVAEAINAYFLEGKDPYDVITNWDNIHDFLYGIKGGSTFEYWLLDIKDNVLENIDRYNERAFRYYISKEGKSILKNWTGGKKLGDLPSAVAGTKGMMIQPLQNIPDKAGKVFRRTSRGRGDDKVVTIETRYPDLDYDYYVREAWKWINLLENAEELSEEESIVHASI